MKNFSECTNGKKINVSTKELGLTEEQIFKLRVAGIEKIDLILVAGDQRIVEILDIDLDIGRDIKISVGSPVLDILGEKFSPVPIVLSALLED